MGLRNTLRYEAIDDGGNGVIERISWGPYLVVLRTHVEGSPHRTREWDWADFYFEQKDLDRRPYWRKLDHPPVEIARLLAEYVRYDVAFAGRSRTLGGQGAEIASEEGR